MDKEVQYISYFSVFAKYKWRIIIGTLLAFILMLFWCRLGLPPMKKKWMGKATLIYQLQKSSLAIKRTLGSLDIPVGGLGGILGGAGTAYNNIPVLNSRRVILKVLDQVPEAKAELTKGATVDDETLAKAFRKRVKIDDSVDGYLEISVLWNNRDTAANLANALVVEMQSALENLNRENAKFMTDFLKVRITIIEDKMTKADEDVRKFKEESNILAVDEQATEMIKTYSQLMVDYTTAEMEFTDAATRWKLINNEKHELAEYIKKNVPARDIFDLQQLKEDPVITLYDNGVILEKAPAVEAFEDTAISKLRRDISDLTLELEHKKLLFTDDHPDVIALKKRIYDAKRALYQQLENYTNSAELSLQIEKLAYEAKRDVISGIMKDLEKKINEFPASEAQLVRLIRDQKVYDEVYMLLMQEYEQALLAVERPETTFQVLDGAVPIRRPARPKSMQNSLGFAFIIFAILVLSAFNSEQKRIHIQNEG
jgi:succinoglycan biosynthesis transport protein ExoP